MDTLLGEATGETQTSMEFLVFIHLCTNMLCHCRLGAFLFSRVLKDGKDSRFDKVRGNPKLFWIYWTIQGNIYTVELQWLEHLWGHEN